MAFLLGSFTNGLFGGARDVMSIAKDWEDLKMKRAANNELLEGVKAKTQALQTDRGAEKARASIEGVTGDDKLPGTTTGAAKTKTFTDDDLNGLPQPKSMIKREALPAASGIGDRAGRPKEGSASVGGISTATPSAAIAASPKTSHADITPDIAEPGQAVAGTSPVWGAIGRAINSGSQALRDYSARYEGQSSAPPTYLPTPAGGVAVPPANSGTPQARPGADPWTGAPMSAIPTGQPNLASSETGLGPRILAALNPTAGSSV